ncbi:MAG: hypothetical protein JEZ08_25460 [Clostridiales bacterium]|nr:hypothetical protein [Clostridiales bacterium]
MKKVRKEMFSKLKVHYYRIRYWIRYKEKLDDGCTMSFFGINEDAGDYIDVEYNKYLDKVADHTQPNAKSIDELISYLIDRYNAEKIKKDRRSYNRFFLNTRQNSSENIYEIKTTDDVLKWLYESKHNSNRFFEKIALDLSDEIKGTQFKPHFFRLKLANEYSKSNMKCPEVNIEETTKTISMINVPKEVGCDIIVFFGVSEEDIAIKSRRFLKYANALRDSNINIL